MILWQLITVLVPQECVPGLSFFVSLCMVRQWANSSNVLLDPFACVLQIFEVTFSDWSKREGPHTDMGPPPQSSIEQCVTCVIEMKCGKKLPVDPHLFSLPRLMAGILSLVHPTNENGISDKFWDSPIISLVYSFPSLFLIFSTDTQDCFIGWTAWNFLTQRKYSSPNFPKLQPFEHPFLIFDISIHPMPYFICSIFL